jgi:hypothetical protein
MKKWIALASALAILIGVGALLLSTRQAPLLEDADPAAIPLATGTTVTATDTSPPSPPESSPPAQIKGLSVEEFRTLTAKVAQALPTKESVKGLSEQEAHNMPKPIAEAGAQLGQIAQAVSQEPSLGQEAYSFYEKCSASAQYLDAVRALCFSNYKEMGTKLGLAVREETAPAKIRELSEKIQGL